MKKNIRGSRELDPCLQDEYFKEQERVRDDADVIASLRDSTGSSTELQGSSSEFQPGSDSPGSPQKITMSLRSKKQLNSSSNVLLALPDNTAILPTFSPLANSTFNDSAGVEQFEAILRESPRKHASDSARTPMQQSCIRQLLDSSTDELLASKRVH